MKQKFIDFLTEKFSRSEFVGKAYGTDKEMIEHFLSGEVTIPITLAIEFFEKNSTPSQHQVGDKVLFSINQTYGENPYPFTAEVKTVHFYAGKVKYDLEIPIANEAPTRVYNIDSCFVLPID